MNGTHLDFDQQMVEDAIRGYAHYTFALILLIIGAIVKVKGLLEFRVYTKQLAKGQNAIMYQKTLSND